MFRAILLLYYSVTTLSTVGFGDFYPVSTFERLCASFMLFCGYITFSLMQGQLFGMIHKINTVDDQFDDSQNLDQFILQIRRFNLGVTLQNNLEQRIQDFFIYKWSTEKNMFLTNNEEKMIMSQLPHEVVVEIYRDFIFKEFLTQFRRMFRFKKQRNMFTEFAQDHMDNLNIKDVDPSIDEERLREIQLK
jgi:hypothetical protein